VCLRSWARNSIVIGKKYFLNDRICATSVRGEGVSVGFYRNHYSAALTID
jgi:hypothetical protein